MHRGRLAPEAEQCEAPSTSRSIAACQPASVTTARGQGRCDGTTLTWGMLSRMPIAYPRSFATFWKPVTSTGGR